MSSAPHQVRTRRRWPPGPTGNPLKAALLVLLVVAVAAATIGGLLRLRTDTGPASVLPPGSDAVSAMDHAAREFGGDSIVVLLEARRPGELLGAEQLPKLIGLEGALSRLPDVATVYGPGSALNQIATSSQNLIAEISGRRDSLMAQAERDARSRGASDTETNRARERAVEEFDLRYASLLVRGLPSGLPTLHNPNFARAVVFDPADQPRPRWRFMVPSTTAVAVSVRPREELDQRDTERLVDAVRATAERAGLSTARITVSGAPTVAAAMGEQVRREVPLLGGLAVGLIALCYLLVPWQPRRTRRLVPLTATLGATSLVLAGFGWLGRPVSLGVIAFLPILMGIGSDFPAYLEQGTPRRRVLVAAAASATGFAALAASPVPFVRDLGLALAAGVLLAVTLALASRHLRNPDAVPEPRPNHRPALPRGRSPRVRIGLLAALSAVALGGWLLLPRLDVQAQPDRLAEGLSAVRDAHHVEEVLGSSGEVQIVLRGPNILTPQALAWMRQVQNGAIRDDGDQLRVIASLPDLLGFLGPDATEDQIDAGLHAMPSYLTGAVASPDFHTSVIRLGIRLQDLGDQQRLLDRLRSALPPPPDGYRAELTGLPVAAAQAYGLVSHSRYLSNSLGILLAGLVLLIGLRRRTDAARAVLAAVLATGWGLAAAWALAVPLTPMTIALGSLSTATACEFTVVLASARQVASNPRRTVLVAALAACLGYAALMASSLAVIRDFGLLLAATVGLSWLAAHLVVRVMPPRHLPTDRQPGRVAAPARAVPAVSR